MDSRICAIAKTSILGLAMLMFSSAPCVAQGSAGAVKGGENTHRAPGGLSELEVAVALANGTPSHTFAAEIRQRGFQLYFEEGDEEAFRALGAMDDVVDALRAAPIVWVMDLRSKVTSAVTSLRLLLAKQPANPALHMWLGAALLDDNKADEAIAELHQALTLGLGLAFSHIRLGWALGRVGRNQEGIDELKESHRLKPNYLCIAFAVLKDDTEGRIAQVRRCMDADPENPNIHQLLGNMLLRQNNIDEALHEEREAVRLSPRVPMSHQELAWALYAKTDYDGAASEFREALKLSGLEMRELHTNLADCLYRSKQFEEAAAEARVVLLYDPKNTQGKKVLQDARAEMAPAGASESGARSPSGTLKGGAATPMHLRTATSDLANTKWSCKQFQRELAVGPDQQTYGDELLRSSPCNFEFYPNGDYHYCDEVQKGRWQQSGSSIQWTAMNQGWRLVQGTISDGEHMTARMGQPQTLNMGGWHMERYDCTLTSSGPDQVSSPVDTGGASSAATSEHPAFHNRCVRMEPGDLGEMTLTNVCSQPVDLKWCYRKHGTNDPWQCQVTPKLPLNHMLETPKCYQCSYDARIATYYSSENLIGSLPSDQEMSVANPPGSSPETNSGSSSLASDTDDGQRRWRLVNPSQNWDSVTFEARGRSGESNSDDWNDETPITTVNLKPGGTFTLNCDQWFSLDIKWYLSSAQRSDVDTFWASLVCYANNPEWNRAKNTREYDFPRQ